MVAHRRHAAVDRAGADRDQDPAVGAELAQHVHVVRVAQPALDEADVAGAAMLDVGQRRAVELDSSSSSTSRSSMSRKDMWQPKQPASDVVAMRSLLIGVSSPSPARPFPGRASPTSMQVERAPSDRHFIAVSLIRIAPTGQMCTAMSPVSRSLSAELPAWRIHDEMRACAAPGDCEHFLPSTSRLARTHSSQRMQRLRSSITVGCEASTARRGKNCGKCPSSMPR